MDSGPKGQSRSPFTTTWGNYQSLTSPTNSADEAIIHSFRGGDRAVREALGGPVGPGRGLRLLVADQRKGEQGGKRDRAQASARTAWHSRARPRRAAGRSAVIGLGRSDEIGVQAQHAKKKRRGVPRRFVQTLS